MLLDSGAGNGRHRARQGKRTRGSASSSDRSSAWIAKPPPRHSSEFLARRTYTPTRSGFVQTVIEHLTANGVVEVARLYESPFTDHAPHGPDSLFSDDEVDGIVDILHTVREHALPDATVA